MIKETYKDFIAHDGLVVVKYSLPNCAPCKLLKPTWNKFLEETKLKGLEITLSDFKKEDFPQVKKAPTVEFFVGGISKQVLSGKELHFNKLMEVFHFLIKE